MSLEKVSESLVDQLPSAGNAGKLRAARRLEKFGDFAWNSFALAIVVTIGTLIYHVTTGVPVEFEPFVAAIIGFAILCVIHRVLSERAETRRKVRAIGITNNGVNHSPLDGRKTADPLFVEADTQKLVN